MYFEIMTNPFKTMYSPDQSQTVTDVVLFLLRQTLGFRESTESIIMFLFFKYFYSAHVSSESRKLFLYGCTL